MVFMFICNAQVTYALLIFAAENLHKFSVVWTEAFFESFCSLHKLVFPLHMQDVMQIYMISTERSQAVQTGLLCFTLSSCAYITLHIRAGLCCLIIHDRKLKRFHSSPSLSSFVSPEAEIIFWCGCGSGVRFVFYTLTQRRVIHLTTITASSCLNHPVYTYSFIMFSNITACPCQSK